MFTPYKNNWLHQFEANNKNIPDYEFPLKNLRKFENPDSILTKNWYKVIGFKENLPILPGGTKEALKRIKRFEEVISDYKDARNFPAVDGTSYISVYIRFGNISVRDLIRAAASKRSDGASTWLSEIVWRDFYQMILDQFPHVATGSFKKEYDKINWQGTESHLRQTNHQRKI